MSGFHDVHSASSTTTASAPSTTLTTLPQPQPDVSSSSSSPYHPHPVHYTPNPAHAHSTYRHAHDALSPHAGQNGNGNGNVPRHGQVTTAYAHTATNNLTAALHAVTDVHGQDAASPSLQYSPGAHHDLHAPAHSGSASPPSKKNTRIPRACDLCSQRKVKVRRCQPPSPPPIGVVVGACARTDDGIEPSAKVANRHVALVAS